jgi:SRSO17 transposase
MAGRILDWRRELERWLRPFLERLGHKTRRRMCPVYISGLIGPGDRKSIQPMAERIALGAYDQLHHFVSAEVWDMAPVETELLIQADKLVGGRDAVLVIDDTAVLKKGTHSVGVAPPILLGAGQDRQLSDPSIADAGARRSAGHGGNATVPSRKLDG